MFLGIWHYFRGYVMIEVSGFSVERFINLATHKGIYLWDIQRHHNTIRMKVSIAGFRLLRHCTKKTRCRIKILEKKGWPFLAHKYRKRKFLAMGILMFIGTLYILASFIWVIEIQGTQRIHKDQLVTACIEAGLKPGAWKPKVSKNEVEKKLMKQFKDISWVAIEIKGTKAKIQLVETLAEMELIDRTTPCDVVAKKYGLITSVVVSSGTPKVKPKDVVQKGDTLISGELLIKEDETDVVKKFVHAIAEVRAKLWYEIYTEQSMIYIEKKYTGQAKKHYRFQIMEYPINLLKTSISYENYDKITTRHRLNLGGDFALPVEWIIEDYKEFIPNNRKRTLAEGKKLAEASIELRFKEVTQAKESEVEHKQIQYVEQGNILIAKAVITTIERIDEQKKMNIDWNNEE